MKPKTRKKTRATQSVRRRPAPASLRGPNHPLFPACDGQPWKAKPAQEAMRSRVQREFLDAYFRVNLAYARLARWRKTARKLAGSGRDRVLLRAVEKAILNRERVEDRHAPRGWAVTPVYSDGYAVDLKFCDAITARRSRQPVNYSASCVIRIPLPAGLRAHLCKS